MQTEIQIEFLFSSLKETVEKLAVEACFLVCRRCNVISKYKGLQVSKERMHLRKGGNELAGSKAGFPYFTLKHGHISEAGFRIFRLITMIVWLIFSGIFCT